MSYLKIMDKALATLFKAAKDLKDSAEFTHTKTSGFNFSTALPTNGKPIKTRADVLVTKTGFRKGDRKTLYIEFILQRDEVPGYAGFNSVLLKGHEWRLEEPKTVTPIHAVMVGYRGITSNE